jgi:RNA polymerase sigma factor (sigma-70 family)
VIEKKYFGRYTQQQIAAQLGIRPGTVRSRLSRAYARLRRMLPDELEQFERD